MNSSVFIDLVSTDGRPNLDNLVAIEDSSLGSFMLARNNIHCRYMENNKF